MKKSFTTSGPDEYLKCMQCNDQENMFLLLFFFNSVASYMYMHELLFMACIIQPDKNRDIFAFYLS